MGPPPPPAVEGKERVRTLLISTEGAIQTPSPSIIHKLPGACTPGPPQLVDLLPRGCPNEESWLPSCRPCEPPPFRWQAIRLPSDGQLLQITTPSSFPPGIPPMEDFWTITTTGPGETTTILCTTTLNKGTWPGMRNNCSLFISAYPVELITST